MTEYFRNVWLNFQYLKLSPSFFVYVSAEVNSPEQFQRLLHGFISGYDIKSTAHPDLFSTVKDVARLPLTDILQGYKFTDANNNFIILRPQQKDVTADFSMGPIKADRMSNLPYDYQTYDITIDTATNADLDAIQRWPYDAVVMITLKKWPSLKLKKRIGAIEKSREGTVFSSIR